jgi:hypothetical protein
MKLKDLLGNVVKNKSNGQLNTCIKNKQLKKVGLSEHDLLNMKLDLKTKRLFNEELKGGFE